MNQITIKCSEAHAAIHKKILLISGLEGSCKSDGSNWIVTIQSNDPMDFYRYGREFGEALLKIKPATVQSGKGI